MGADSGVNVGTSVAVAVGAINSVGVAEGGTSVRVAVGGTGVLVGLGVLVGAGGGIGVSMIGVGGGGSVGVRVGRCGTFVCSGSGV